MKNCIYNLFTREMLVHVPLCLHPTPYEVLAPTQDDVLLSEIKKHHLIKNVYKNVQECQKNSIDIVICEQEAQNSISLEAVLNLIKDDGIFVLMLPDKPLDSLIDKIESISSVFFISMLYSSSYYNYPDRFFLISSNKYHPTADIILQRSDFIENTKYYTSDIHLASFALPKYIQEKLKGILRN